MTPRPENRRWRCIRCTVSESAVGLKYTIDKRAARSAMTRPADRRLASEVFSAVATAAASFRQMFLHKLFNSRFTNSAAAMMRGRMDVFGGPPPKSAPANFRQSA